MHDISHPALPFVVGVTGHRRVKDPVLLTEDFERSFIEMAACVPACRPVLLSALAAGADQIAARVALNLGWQLVAVLPFPPGDKRHGFLADEQAEFDDLLNKASHWIDASALAGLRFPGSENRASDEQHFLAAGRYIANAAHVLVSGWDGVDSTAVGGTADITRYRLNMLPLRIDPLSLAPILDEWKLVLVVPTRREGEENAPSCPAGWYTSRMSLDGRKPDFRDAQEALQPFKLLNEASAKIHTADKKTIVADDDLGRIFGVVDHFAITHVTWLRKNWLQSFVLALLALISAGIYGDLKDLVPMPSLVLGLYLGTLAVLWVLIRREVREAEKRQPWDWRLFAEILRVLRVWRRAGHGETEPSLAPTLGARHHVPAWVIHAYRGLLHAGHRGEEALSKDERKGLHGVNQSWVHSQIAYFDRVIRATRWQKNLRSLSASSLPIGVILAGVCLVLEILGQGGKPLSYSWFAAGLLPGLGAAGLVFSQLREKAGASAAALRQREKFIALRATLEGNPDPAKARMQIAEAGRLAVVEVCVFHEYAKLTHSESAGFLG